MRGVAPGGGETNAYEAYIDDGYVIHDKIIQQPLPEVHHYDLVFGNIDNEHGRLELGQLDRITVHHTWTSNPTRPIEYVHVDWIRDRWNRPGYHFIVRNDGEIWQIMPIHFLVWGAANPLGFEPSPNARSIHIAFDDRLTADNLPSQAAIDSFGFLCRLLIGSSQLPSLHDSREHIVGHRTWRNNRADDCPGVLRETYLSWI